MANTTIPKDGEEVQIRVWVPSEMYALIAERATELGTSKAAVTRQIMIEGLRVQSRNHQEWEQIERRAWFSAKEAAKVFELLSWMIYVNQSGNSEQRQEALRKVKRESEDRANQRLLQYLHEEDLNNGSK